LVERETSIQVRLSGDEKRLMADVAALEKQTYSGLVRLWLRTSAEQLGLLQPVLTINGGQHNGK